jgi:hypothetical protein
MNRLLLATCLLLFASSAFAKSPVSTEDPADGSAKAGKTTTTAAVDGDPTAPAHPVVAPVRTGTLPTRGSAPRWHSLLPGMIR